MLSCRKCLAMQFGFLNLRVITRTRAVHYGRVIRTNIEPRLLRSPKFSVISSCQQVTSFVTHMRDGLFVDDALLEEHHDDEGHEEIAVHSEPDIPVEGVPTIQGADAKPKTKGKKVSKGQNQAISRNKDEGDNAAKLMEQKLKEATHRRSLVTYLSVCMQQKMTYKAMSVLRNYHRSKKLTKCSQVYDAVLMEAAAQCNWQILREVMRMMEEGQVPYTITSHAAFFICLGWRSLSEKGLEPMAEELLNRMSVAGLKVEDIFLAERFSRNHRELAVRGVRLARPDFECIFPSTPTHYSTPLLQSLNDRGADRLPEASLKSPLDGMAITSDKLNELALEQYNLETSDFLCIPSVSSAKPDKAALAEVKALETSWEAELKDAVARHLAISKAHFESRSPRSAVHIYPFLTLLSEDAYVNLILNEVRVLSRFSEMYSPSVYLLSRDLGNKVMEHAHLESKKQNGIMDKFRRVYEQYCGWYANPSELSTENGVVFNPRQAWQHLVTRNQQDGPDLNAEDSIWPHSVIVGVGEFLYNIILNSLKIQPSAASAASAKKVSGQADTSKLTPPAKVAAFYLVYRTKGFKTSREIKPHPRLVELWQELRHSQLTFDSTLLPMFSPPLPWHAVGSGGYLTRNVRLIRLASRFTVQRQRMDANPLQQLYPALDALNVLGSVPWRINGRVLDLLIDVFNAGGSHELDVAPNPANLPPFVPSLGHTPVTAEEKIKINKERANYKRHKSEMYSLWCDALYRLSLAQHYRERIFWFPHSMDFRGRVYPCSPHLTYLAQDMGRALFLFAQGKPLGPGGLDWLKLHTINLTGTKKKEPMRERLRYADEILEDILDSAQNPMTGKKWWTKSDEPWQTLAACMEIDAALRCPDGPAAYICHLPIHQDGSCNGLQHYAALGRDQSGAESVNLAPADRPGDVYNTVATLVERERAKDEATGNSVALMLKGHVSRPIVKQTVMTVVYGVTRFGARLQIIKQLKEIPAIPPEHLPVCASYLADKTFASLKEMFTSAREIQDWFTESAKMIVSVAGQNVEWVTPLGLPVVQPYVKSFGDPLSKPNGLKQKNGFPPNFIHSLDSSHMMLTALFCQRAGITFTAVHDCFWTHPCTVNPMNKICREQFVSLHSQPILENLSEFLVSRFSCSQGEVDDGETSEKTVALKQRLDQILTEVPRRGTFDLRRVLDSVYFFS